MFMHFAANKLKPALMRAWYAMRALPARKQLFRQNEAFNHAILNSLTIHIAVLDCDGLIVAVNQAWERFAQANGAGFPNRTGVGANYLAVCRQSDATDAANGIQAVLSGAQSDFTLEYPCHSPTEQRWFLLSAAPFALNAGGVVVSHTNITQRKQTEEALRSMEAHNRALVEAIPDAMILAHSDGADLKITPSPDAVVNKPLAQLIRQQVQDRQPAALAEQFIHHWRQALATREMQAFEFDTQVDEKSYVFEARIAPAGVADVITLVRDITARKQVEEKNIQLLQEVAQQHTLLRALNQRLAEIQEQDRKALSRELHDRIGQNLTALGIDLSIIRAQLSGQLSGVDPVYDRLSDAMLLVTQTTEQIRDVMVDLHPPMLDGYGLLVTLNWYARQVTKRSGVAIVVQGEESKPPLSEQIALTLFRITQEALTNVIKHAQATKVIIELTNKGNAVWLSVADNGCGFAPALLPDVATSQQWGLLVMRERAEAIGGHCSIEGRPGKGTTVSIEVAQ
ncbi:MAG: PAS domain-containing protein [Chloroflexi bacterium]|nr:PAS domain-containing protein [Chloroflexota bacterium]